ncbi:hypothetical protein PQX77_007289 [Marasmius sp. AFHP31]|nr:hypothetical protein PQX77_007289 [Marasmius sp. AFHP31]
MMIAVALHRHHIPSSTGLVIPNDAYAGLFTPPPVAPYYQYFSVINEVMVNFYNLSILDSSPTIIYSPYREVEDVASGWKSAYTGSPDSVYDNTFQGANRASGSSYHATTMQGASFELMFIGTAAYIYGSGSAGGYTTSLDNGAKLEGAPREGLLVSYENLEYKVHRLALTLTQNQSLSVSSALLTVGIGKTGAVVTNTTIDAVNINADGTSSLNSDYFYMSGNGVNTRGTSDVLAYSRVDTNVAGSAIHIQFSRASAIQVKGATYHDHGIFSATLNPSAGASTSPRTFNATSKWFVSDTLIYWETGLDRTQQYTLSLTNGEQNKYLDVHSIVLMDGEGGTDDTDSSSAPPVFSSFTLSQVAEESSTGIAPSRSSDASSPQVATPLGVGMTTGIAVGAGVVAVLVTALIFCWFKGRRKQAPEHHLNKMVKKAPPPSPQTTAGQSWKSLGVESFIFTTLGEFEPGIFAIIPVVREAEKFNQTSV